jgi:hypothetical protein
MFRLLFGLGVVVVILTIYTVVDCALFDRSRIRGLPRWAWILIIVFIPVIGPILWLLIGRGRRNQPVGRTTRTMAPDDDIDFLKGLNKNKDQEERIRQMEQELADLDDSGTTPDGPAGRPGAAGVDPNTTEPGEGDQPGRRDA